MQQFLEVTALRDVSVALQVTRDVATTVASTVGPALSALKEERMGLTPPQLAGIVALNIIQPVNIQPRGGLGFGHDSAGR